MFVAHVLIHAEMSAIEYKCDIGCMYAMWFVLHLGRLRLLIFLLSSCLGRSFFTGAHRPCVLCFASLDVMLTKATDEHIHL